MPSLRVLALVLLWPLGAAADERPLSLDEAVEQALQQAMPAACCVAAPIQSQKLTFESGRSARERDQNSGSPDLAINAGWPPPNRQFAHAHAAPHQGAPDSRIDGTLTYLLTGRLRL